MTQLVLKPWWSWTYQNFAVKRASAWAIPGWVTSWEVRFKWAKSGQYCVIGGGSLQMVSEPLPSLRWWERAQAQWGTPAGTLGPKRGWLWRPTLPENVDVLIWINAPFMTQRVLKPWWSWTYQNSAVKRTSARAISGWVTSWKVWFEEPKADNIVSLGVCRYSGKSTWLITCANISLRGGLPTWQNRHMGNLPRSEIAMWIQYRYCNQLPNRRPPLILINYIFWNSQLKQLSRLSQNNKYIVFLVETTNQWEIKPIWLTIYN
jgi:hypothetical protein